MTVTVPPHFGQVSTSYLEDPLEALRPSHRRALLSRCAVFGWLCGLRTPAPAGRHDPGPMGAVGCEHPVEASEIQARRRDEHRALSECGLPEARSALTKPARACRQPGDEIQWAMSGRPTPWCGSIGCAANRVEISAGHVAPTTPARPRHRRSYEACGRPSLNSGPFADHPTLGRGSFNSE